MTAGKRRTAREMAVQMLYQCDLGGSSAPTVFTTFDFTDYLSRPAGARKKKVVHRKDPADVRDRSRLEESFLYAQNLVNGTLDHREEIDSMIRGQADNWRLERMPAVDRNILRLAVYEMLYERETPKLVVVDEAIELAKKFGSEQSGRFVNGLLDGLLKQHTFPGTLT